MELEKFIEKLADQFDDTDKSLLKPDTIFRDLDEWGSITVLSVIAMADEEYDVELELNDIKKARTIEDLFDVIRSKK